MCTLLSGTFGLLDEPNVGMLSEVMPSSTNDGASPDEKSVDDAQDSSVRPAGLVIERLGGETPAKSSRESPPPLESEKFIEREVIGRGGSSVVVRALDREILRNVAIKLLSAEPGDDPQQVERFAEEARINGQLEHPSIVPIYEFGLQPNGRRFLCMKMLEGETLEDALARAGTSRLQPDRLADFLQVFVKACDAVSFAHSRGVIHRDLKPANIMMSEFGQVYVLDWGIAQLLPPRAATIRRVRLDEGEAKRREPQPPGVLIGTPSYMAPEQLQGMHDALDERTDVFALGATLYQILTGQPPLTSEIIRAIWVRQPPPAIAPPDRVVEGRRVPPGLSRIAMRALSYEPADRYGSVAELKRDVDHFQRGTWHLPRCELLAGTVILREGEPGSTAYVIEEGQCVAYRVDDSTEIELRRMGPGEVFGETAVFTEKPRSASVKALTDVVLLVVTGEALSQAVGMNSWMGAFVKALADRFREADERLRALDNRPVSRP
jgi:eukaryotic-like serine/threonine-protein kinase